MSPRRRRSALLLGLAFVAWLMALKLTDDTARIGNLIFVAPFISLQLIAHVLGEPIHPSVYAGLVLILGALVIQQRGRAKAPAEADPAG